MINAAQIRLKSKWPAVKLVRGGVGVMECMQEKSFDFLFVLNVLAYLNAAEEEEFYRQARRIVRPGGVLIVTHSNELFDVFTFNRYTVNFFSKHFSRLGTECNIDALLTNPGIPNRFVFNVRENPLAYHYKLNKYGFAETRQEFAILHSLPPLLTPDIEFDEINSRTYLETTNWPEEERWKLMFMCSIFGSRSICKA
jgi:SAM-dependent methyltransferase